MISYTNLLHCTLFECLAFIF